MSDETPSTAGAANDRVTTGDSVQVIKADIERTQAELADTLDALQQKLQPKRLIGEARGAARDYASRWTRDATRAGLHGIAVGAAYAEQATGRVRQEIEARPTSAVLIGSGLASLWFLWLTRGARRRRIERDDRRAPPRP